MIDLRKERVVDLTSSKCLKEEASYFYTDPITHKKLVAKFIAHYDDEEDEYLIIEFKKIALLSAEPEIVTVYFLTSADYGAGAKSCYVMDFVAGQTLRAFLENSTNLDSKSAFEIIQQIASGLEKAHHYEISHGDLHQENIMINNFGYVKILDFLWWDFRLSFEHNSKEDLSSFKLIVESVAEKLSGNSRGRFEILRKYLTSIESFKGVPKNIGVLGQIVNDLALIDDESKQILARIVRLMVLDANLNHILNQIVPIPSHYIPELDEDDKKWIEADKNPFGLKMGDTRAPKIQTNLKRVFGVKLHQLRQAGLIDWEMGVKNTGEKFIGPYVVHFHIHFTYKLFEWKRLNEEFQFLSEPAGRSLMDLILENDGYKTSG